MSCRKNSGTFLPLSMPRLFRTNASKDILVLTPGLCKSVLSMMMAYERMKTVSEFAIFIRMGGSAPGSSGPPVPPPVSRTPSASATSSADFSRAIQRVTFVGSEFFAPSAASPPASSPSSSTGGWFTKNAVAKLSMSLSMSCASPGSRNAPSTARSASTMPRPVNAKSSMKALLTCWLKSLRLARYSPTWRRSSCGVWRRNSAMDSGVGGLETSPSCCSTGIHFEGSLLKLLAAMASRRFCSFLRCSSVLGSAASAPCGAGGCSASSAGRKCLCCSQRSATEWRIEVRPLSARRWRELKLPPLRAPLAPSEGKACVTRNFTSVSKRLVQRTSQS
mmetsp:Transcript_105178/g.297796  ORF Transcript_105178/g.297796 Transcript_105178/m.297796 type:complete len:334 (+) Transcript_105178:1016-2017(+)